MSIQFAVVDGTQILNLIMADSLEIAEQVSGGTCVETPHNYMDKSWTYDPYNGKFIPPIFTITDSSTGEIVSYHTFDPDFHLDMENGIPIIDVNPLEEAGN